MKKAQIFYFSLQDEQTKEEKLKWFSGTKLNAVPFQHIQPDQKGNWIDLTTNDFDSLIPLIDKDVKAGKSEAAIFQLFSSGVKTQRDEWVYDFSKEHLSDRMKFFVDVYERKRRTNEDSELDIKWDRELIKYLDRGISKQFETSCIQPSLYRPFTKMYLYFDKHFNGVPYQMRSLFPDRYSKNQLIAVTNHTQIPFLVQALDCIPEVAVGGRTGQCLPLYRYDKDGNRFDNITDWGLQQFQQHYSDTKITKEDIFHYTYAVLHNPTYRSKYELNLKREFPRLPFYPNFHQWVNWGKQLMDIHIHYETVQPFGLDRLDHSTKSNPKPKLRADKTAGTIDLDDNTQLKGIPSIAWDYKLGNRSALEWILDQYKEKKPKDPTIAAKFNTYKFADYKEQVINLLDRVCTVSVKTMDIIGQMPDSVEHQRS